MWSGLHDFSRTVSNALLLRLQVLVKDGGQGQLVFNATSIDDALSNIPTKHSMDLYEVQMEMFLTHRRQWLWKKAIFVVRCIIKLRGLCKASSDLETGTNCSRKVNFDVETRSQDKVSIVPTMGEDSYCVKNRVTGV